LAITRIIFLLAKVRRAMNPTAGLAGPRAKSHTTVSAWTQRQMNRFDWGFGKAPHGQDGGGRQANVMAWKEIAAWMRPAATFWHV
jgi:hypothetical protein